MIRRKGPFLTERNSFQATTRNPQSNQIVLDGLGPSVAQGEVVLFRSALIAMTLSIPFTALMLGPLFAMIPVVVLLTVGPWIWTRAE